MLGKEREEREEERGSDLTDQREAEQASGSLVNADNSLERGTLFLSNNFVTASAAAAAAIAICRLFIVEAAAAAAPNHRRFLPSFPLFFIVSCAAKCRSS